MDGNTKAGAIGLAIPANPAGQQVEILSRLRLIRIKLSNLDTHLYGVKGEESPDAPPYTPDDMAARTSMSLDLVIELDNRLANILDRL